MSQYKSAIRSQPQEQPTDSTKFRSQARQLQEFFPNWTNDGTHPFNYMTSARPHFFFAADLLTVLNEVGGDVQLAATRISDGQFTVPFHGL